MDEIETVSKTAQKLTFINHMTKFDDDTKSELLNILQYSLLAIIPIVFLNKGIGRFIPDADESKGNIEIIFEVISQTFVMFIGIFIIHRLITYVPTYSGERYGELNIINIIIGILVIVLSLQTKLGEKMNILVDRLLDLWDGNTTLKEGEKQKQKQEAPQRMRSANPFPTPEPLSLKNEPSQVNYNSMHQQQNTPLVNANSPHNQLNVVPPPMELMAANEALGGGFGSMF
jgi:hypothetical protein